MPKLNETVSLSLGSNEAQDLKNAARFRGASLQRYLRSVVLAAVKKDLEERKSQAPARRPRNTEFGPGVNWIQSRGHYRVRLYTPDMRMPGEKDQLSLEMLFLGTFRSLEAATACRDHAQSMIDAHLWNQYLGTFNTPRDETHEQRKARLELLDGYLRTREHIREASRAVGKMFEPD